MELDHIPPPVASSPSDNPLSLVIDLLLTKSLPPPSDDYRAVLMTLMESLLQRCYYQLLYTVQLYEQANIDRKVVQTVITTMLPVGHETTHRFLLTALQRTQQQEESLSTDRPLNNDHRLLPHSLIGRYLKSLGGPLERPVKLTKGAKVFLTGILEQLFTELIRESSKEGMAPTFEYFNERMRNEPTAFLPLLIRHNRIYLYSEEYDRVVPRDTFERIVRGVIRTFHEPKIHLGRMVIEVLQWYVESRILEFISEGLLLKKLVKRSTFNPEDLLLVLKLRGFQLVAHPGLIAAVEEHLTEPSAINLTKRIEKIRSSHSLYAPIANLMGSLLYGLLQPTVEYMVGSRRTTLNIKVLRRGALLGNLIMPLHKNKK